MNASKGTTYCETKGSKLEIVSKYKEVKIKDEKLKHCKKADFKNQVQL